MDKFLVLDNVLEYDDFLEIKKVHIDVGISLWYENGQHNLYDKLLKVCQEHYDLSQSPGYEIWCNNMSIDWHADIDDDVNKRTGVILYPICTIIFYLDVEIMSGGSLVTPTIMVQPIPNRMVIFGPGIQHGVQSYEGTRRALSINPWNTKPVKFTDTNISTI